MYLIFFGSSSSSFFLPFFLFSPVVCILFRISLLLTYVTVYSRFSCLLSYFPHYMFRPQRVILRCSTYITLPLYCALTHFFFFQVATSMYIHSPPCSMYISL
jgi:hypothetical protein